MTLDLGLITGLIALGLAAGFLAGLLGIGGGMVMVPFMTMMMSSRGFPVEHLVHTAVATSLATICFTSLSSVRAHHKRGAVRWDIVKRFAPGIVAGSLVGPHLAAALKTSWLSTVFAVFVAFSATQMILDRKPKPTRELPAAPGLFGVGGVIGILSALVGAGGGFLSVPFMTWCNVAIHKAVATSAALGFPIALATTIGFIHAGWNLQDMPSGSIGYVYLPALLIIAVGSVLMAPIGARAAHAMNVKQLKQAFAIVLYLLAAYMLYKAITL